MKFNQPDQVDFCPARIGKTTPKKSRPENFVRGDAVMLKAD
jgi:hypothetical protein